MEDNQRRNPDVPNFNDENLRWITEPIQPEKSTFRPIIKNRGLGVEKYEAQLANFSNEGANGEYFPAANMD